MLKRVTIDRSMVHATWTNCCSGCYGWSNGALENGAPSGLSPAIDVFICIRTGGIFSETTICNDSLLQ